MIFLWSARVVWALLPLTMGNALADALEDWSTAPARLAAVMLWAAWAAGLIALLAPRPWGLTILRVVAPAAVIVAVATVFADASAASVVAITSALVAAVLALSAPVVDAAGNSLAYGDEQRFALRIPTPLLLGPVPIAIVVVIAAAAGPLLVADEAFVAGAIVILLAIPAVAIAVRSLYALARRWVVLVPAGLVVVDPLTLVDPVLLRREQILGLGAVAPADATIADLRLGSRGGSIAVTAAEPVEIARRAGRNGVDAERVTVLLVAPIRPSDLLPAARDRRIPVR